MHLLNNKKNRLGDVATFEESTTKIAQSNENSLKQSMGPTNDHLDALEAQSIYIFREAFARLKELALLWSLGKDSNVMIWLARKAFFGRVPFPAMHVDTGKKFPEMYAF